MACARRETIYMTIPWRTLGIKTFDWKCRHEMITRTDGSIKVIGGAEFDINSQEITYDSVIILMISMNIPIILFMAMSIHTTMYDNSGRFTTLHIVSGILGILSQSSVDFMCRYNKACVEDIERRLYEMV